MSWFVHDVLLNFHIVPKVYALSCSYLDCLEYFRFFPILCPNCALWALNNTHHDARPIEHCPQMFVNRTRLCLFRVVPSLKQALADV